MERLLQMSFGTYAATFIFFCMVFATPAVAPPVGTAVVARPSPGDATVVEAESDSWPLLEADASDSAGGNEHLKTYEDLSWADIPEDFFDKFLEPVLESVPDDNATEPVREALPIIREASETTSASSVEPAASTLEVRKLQRQPSHNLLSGRQPTGVALAAEVSPPFRPLLRSSPSDRAARAGFLDAALSSIDTSPEATALLRSLASVEATAILRSLAFFREQASRGPATLEEGGRRPSTAAFVQAPRKNDQPTVESAQAFPKLGLYAPRKNTNAPIVGRRMAKLRARRNNVSEASRRNLSTTNVRQQTAE
eukprot:GHVT01044384.1.p1 GENE.GHVT01044384.1~~GHVT01044384.1.p1  ORF type:complete len:311 (-),score=44.50 GHVT01044384.1:711-1643(-)